MAVQISGVEVSWGIPSAVKSASDALVTGIVQDVKISVGGSTAEIPDEDGDYVSRVDFGFKNTVTIQTIVTDATPTLPAKGASVTFGSAVDGVPLNTGLCFVDSSEITYKGVDTTGVSMTIVHYPAMVAPAP